MTRDRVRDSPSAAAAPELESGGSCRPPPCAAQRPVSPLRQAETSSTPAGGPDAGGGEHDKLRPEDLERLHVLLSRADAALYRAKDNGRNRIETLPYEPQAG